MFVYVYCSYDGSPVGFQLGRITYDASRTENYALEDLERPSLITKSFIFGTISRAWGWNKEDENYFALYKDIDGSGWYMNFAFEFSEFDELKRFKGHVDSLTRQDFVSACLSFVLKSTDEFGVQIDAEKLRSFIEKMQQDSGDEGGDLVDGLTYFESKASEGLDVSKKIQDSVGIEVEKMGSSRIYANITINKIINEFWNNPAFKQMYKNQKLLFETVKKDGEGLFWREILKQIPSWFIPDTFVRKKITALVDGKSDSSKPSSGIPDILGGKVESIKDGLNDWFLSRGGIR